MQQYLATHHACVNDACELSPPEQARKHREAPPKQMNFLRAINLDARTSVLMNSVTGAWVGGDRDQIRHVLLWRTSPKFVSSEFANQMNLSDLMSLALPKVRFNPSLAVIHVGHRCNLSCAYCYAPKDERSLSAETVQGIARFVGGLPDDLFVQFMGGEPLLYTAEMKSLAKSIARERHGKKTAYGIQTNGLLLLQRGMLNFLEEQEISFGISFDGPNGMSFARYGRNCRRIERRIERLLKFLKSNGHRCGIIGVLSRHNVNGLEAFVKWCLDLGVDLLTLTPLLPGRGVQSVGVSGEEATEALQSLFRYWVKRKLYKRIEIDTFQVLEDNLTSRHRAFMCRKYPCGAGMDQLAFDMNGDIYPCDFMVGQQRFRLGNVSASTVVDIAMSPVMAGIRRATRPSKLTSCGQCSFLSVCGHCISSSYYGFRGITGPRVSCQWDAILIKEVLTELVRNQEYADYVALR